MKRCWMGLCVSAFWWVGVLPAPAVTPATLVDLELREHAVHLTSLRDGRISFFDATRRLRSDPVGDYLQLRGLPDGTAPGPAAGESAEPGVLQLTDGTRLIGRLASIRDDGQSLQWTHPQLGTLDVSLDDLAAVALDGRPMFGPPPAADRVVLLNGDGLSGFLERLVALRVADDDALIELAIDRVARLITSNPRTRASEHGLWLADGSRLWAQSLTIESDAVRAQVRLPGAGLRDAGPWPLSAVERIDLAGSGYVLAPMVDLPWRLSAGGEVFGVSWSPRVEGQTLRLHAPVTLRVEAPPGSARLAFTAALDLDDASPAVRHWADCELLCRSADGVEQRIRLDARSPRAAVNLPVVEGPIWIELLAGAGGPVLDRVVLEDAVLLVRQAGGDGR